MATSMMKFVSIDRSMPVKRDPIVRLGDFGEIYDDFKSPALVRQSSRCEQCGIPYCQVHCPLSNNIPDWLALAAEGRMEEAYRVSQSTNDFPEICGRICPKDRLCEGFCVLEQSRHGTVTIGAVEIAITENAWREGWVEPPWPRRKLQETVGIIGAGPAGLTAAAHLRRRGYRVHVYDRYDRAGGLLIYGIPNFKLEKHIVERRTRLLAEGGVAFEQNFEVGRDATLDDLRARHDAILIATGTYKERDTDVPGAGLDNIFHAMTYLTASNRKSLGDAVAAFDDGTLDAKGKNVAVVGGGDTAMDCVRTAVRQGAKSVKCLYRRDRANMPGSMTEVAHAEEEGVEFIWLAQPEAFLGDGAVGGLRATRIHLGVPDAGGRQTPQPIEGSGFTIDVDMVLKALGFEPEDLPGLFGAPELALSEWGTIAVHPTTMMTNLDGVFAAGDIVRGASLVVWAIRDARLAAEGIHIHLQANLPAAA